MANYVPLDLNLYRKKREDEEASRGTRFYRFKEGDNVLRIMPPWSDSSRFSVQLFSHYRVGMDRRTVSCPRKTVGKRCPVCEAADSLMRSGVPWNAQEVRDLRPANRYLLNVVGMSPDQIDNGVQVANVGERQIYSPLVSFLLDKDWGDFTDPDNGYLVKIIKTTAGGQYPSYSVKPVPKREPIARKEWLEQLHDLDALIEIEDYATIRSFMTGESGGNGASSDIEFGGFEDTASEDAIPDWATVGSQ